MADPGIGSGISTGESNNDASAAGMSSLTNYDTNENGSFIETGVSQMATRAAFLSLFILAGFLGNCMLVATIAQSKRLRVSMLNLHIVSMASVNLVDTTLNMPLILGSTITQTWDFGVFICQVNSSFVQLVNIATLLSLCMMSIDRFIAVINPEKYPLRMNHRNTVIMIIYVWVQAFVFAIPILAGTIPSKAFRARYLCSIADNAPLIYVAISSSFSILIPVLLTIIFFLIIIRSCVRQKAHDRINLPQNHYSNNDRTEQRIWAEFFAARYVGLLCVMWVFLVGPYVTINYIEQFRNSAEVQNLPAFILFQYPWEVDLAFMWMKLSYVLILPILTYVLRKEVWQKIKDLMLCRKSNTITDSAPVRSAPTHKDLEQAKEMRQVQTLQNSFTPPILFANTDGIHVVNDACGVETIDHESELLSESTDTMIMRARKCDVNASHEFLHGDEDTSDYDSQCDPLSVSNPISVKSLPQENETLDCKPPKDTVSKLQSDSIDEGVGSQENSTEVLRDDDRLAVTCTHAAAGSLINTSCGKESWNETSVSVRTEKGDSGIDSTQNTSEKEKKKTRRHRTKSNEGVTSVEQFQGAEKFPECAKAKKDNILGGGESKNIDDGLKKTKRRRRTESLGVEPSGQHSRQSSYTNTMVVDEKGVEKTAVESFIARTNSQSKTDQKKPKKRNKKGLDTTKKAVELPMLPAVLPVTQDQSSCIEDDGCLQCQINQAIEGSPSLGKRPPPRLKPLDFTLRKDLKTASPPGANAGQTNSDDVGISDRNDVLFEKKLIPNIPRRDQGSSPRRKPPESVEFESQQGDESNRNMPGQTAVAEEGTSVVSKERLLKNNAVLSSVNVEHPVMPVPKRRRSGERHVRTNSNNDNGRSGDYRVRTDSNNESDTALLGSNTSSELREMKGAPKSDAVPRPKQRRKKRVSTSESNQDLLTGSSGMSGNASNLSLSSK